MKKLKALINFNDLEKDLYIEAGDIIEREDARADEILAAKVNGQAFAEEVIEVKQKEGAEPEEETEVKEEKQNKKKNNK